MIGPQWFLQWNAVQEHKAVCLLRLALLRDFARKLHAERSTCMTTGNAPRTHEIEALEKRLAELRAEPKTLRLENDPEALLKKPKGTSPTSPKKAAPPLPAGLPSDLTSEKLLRYDRAWELALSLEALSLKWNFWQLEAPIRLEEAESFHNSLTQLLWPKAIVLFVEGSQKKAPEGAWIGRWIGIVEDFQNLEKVTLTPLPGLLPNIHPSFRAL